MCCETELELTSTNAWHVLQKNKDCLWPGAAPRAICNAWRWKQYGFGLLFCLWVWPACRHWVNPEFHTEPESNWGECETICLKAEAKPQVDIAITRQWPETLKKSHKLMSKWRNEGLWNYSQGLHLSTTEILTTIICWINRWMLALFVLNNLKWKCM